LSANGRRGLRGGRKEWFTTMGYKRTAVLMAGMTALFIGIGFMLGGEAGMLIAFAFAAATNLFAYWNSDKMVLRMYGAREATRESQPLAVRHRRPHGGARQPADAARLYHRHRPAERLCNRP
jgi:Zn-dependent protease with chaperone function